MITIPKMEHIKSLSALLAVTLVGGYAGKLYQLVDQSYAAQISSEALRAHVLTSYIPFILNYLAIGFGFTLIVLLSKAETKEQKADYFSGSLMLMALFGLATAAVVIPFAGKLVELAGIGGVPGARAYLITMSLAGALLMISTMGKYLCVAFRTPIKMVIADGVGTTINLIGDALCVRFLPSDSQKLVGIGLTTLVVQVVILTFYLTTQRAYLSLTLQSLKNYWSRGKSLAGQNLFLLTLTISVPLIYTAIFNSNPDSSLTAAYNVGYSLANFFAIPIFALNAVGTGWLASAWEGKDQKDISERISAITTVGILFVIVPALIFLGSLPMILSTFYNLTSTVDRYFPQAFILSLLPSALALPFMCIVNCGEKPKFLAFSEIISHFLIGLPLFLFLASAGNYYGASMMGVVVPSLINSICVAVFAARILRVTTFKGLSNDQDQPKAS